MQGDAQTRERHFAVLTTALFLVFLTPMPAAAQSEKRYSAMGANNTIMVSNSADQPDAHRGRPVAYKSEGASFFKLRKPEIALDFHEGDDGKRKTG